MLQDARFAKPNGSLRQAKEDEIDVFALVCALWRGKLTIFLCTLAAALIGAYYAFVLAVPKFAATTTLEVEVSAPPMVDIESVVSGASTEDAAMNTEVEVIRSRGILENLVKTMDLTADPEFNETLRPQSAFSIKRASDFLRSVIGAPPQLEGADLEAAILNDTVDEVRKVIGASVQRDTYIFMITVTTTSAKKSQAIANGLSQLYLDDQIGQKFSATEDAVTWLSERVAELEIDLRDREDQLKTFRTTANVTSMDAVEALNRQLIDTRDRLATSLADVSVLEARLQRLEERRTAGDAQGAADITGDAMLRRMIQSGRGQATIRARVDALVNDLINNVVRSQQQATTLEQSVDRLEAEVAGQSEDLAQFQQLERELQSTKTLYETFLSRLKEATVQRGLQRADSRVLSAAIPGKAVEPRASLILIFSTIVGLFVGFALVLLHQLRSIGYRTSDELSSDVEIEISGEIPLIPIRKRSQLLDYFQKKPSSAVSEAFRNLRTSLLLSSGGDPPQVIASTSSLPGEGKTTQSIALAHNLAGLGKRVLLIEGDVRRRTLDEYFGSGSQRAGGIVTALESKDFDISDIVVRDPRTDIDILLGEKSNKNAADLFSSDRFQQFLSVLRKKYHFIIIDTPPILVVPDARVIGQHVDFILFNVAWNQTSKAQVRAALRQLEAVNIEPSGLVLSKIDPAAMKRLGHGGKYGAYGNYGQGYYDA